MRVEIAIEGTQFLIDGAPTYSGVSWRGHPLSGLLMNARMVQAVFDDECEATRSRWAYPDTGVWDPDRNTDEFCAALPEYRRHGLLAVTVGLQGGGSIYAPEVYDHYINSAYDADGHLKPAYFDRLSRVLRAADEAGMVVIVILFYFKQVRWIAEDRALVRIVESVMDWLLRTGRRNILVDLANECGDWWKRPLLHPANIHHVLRLAKSITLNGRRIPVGCSTAGGDALPAPRWLAEEDFSLPHGNGCTPADLRAKLMRLKDAPEYRARPRPIVVNEDSVFVENMEAAVKCGCSWGFYCQGYGSQYRDRWDWSARPRETRYADLSGYQTVPVNWGINTEVKRRFFERLKALTDGAE